MIYFYATDIVHNYIKNEYMGQYVFVPAKKKQTLSVAPSGPHDCVLPQMYIYALIYIILAASPLASTGFAVIGYFRASPSGGIYILKNYSKLTAKKSAKFFFRKSKFFLPKTFP